MDGITLDDDENCVQPVVLDEPIAVRASTLESAFNKRAVRIPIQLPPREKKRESLLTTLLSGQGVQVSPEEVQDRIDNGARAFQQMLQQKIHEKRMLEATRSQKEYGLGDCLIVDRNLVLKAAGLALICLGGAYLGYSLISLLTAPGIIKQTPLSQIVEDLGMEVE